jgi:hypothetical protein
MPIIIANSNAPVTFNGQVVNFDNGTPVPGSNQKVITHNNSNDPISYNGQIVIQ